MSDPLIPPSPSYDPTATPPPDDAALFAEAEPFALFARWFLEAKAKEPSDPNATALATVDADGAPDVRMVLLKDFDAAGFVFYSNAESAKGVQLAGNARAALCFHWKSLRRQVRVRGAIELVSDEEADEYFKTRDRGARLGAWASEQSRPLRGSFGAGKTHRRVCVEIRPWRDPAPAALARLAAGSAGDRVLARPAFPFARSTGVHARCAGGSMAQGPAFPLTRRRPGPPACNGSAFTGLRD